MATKSETVLLPGAIAVVPGRLLSSRSLIVRNVCFGLLDYMVQPLLMVLTARYFVRHLGVSLFGVWMLVLAAVGSTGTLCSGFGDAALKYVSAMRGRCDFEGARQVIQTSLTLNFSFGVALAVIFYALAPWASTHIFRSDLATAPTLISALRIGGCLLIVRALSLVYISTLRAFESYQAATQITSITRVAIIICAVIVILQNRGVVAILLGTLVCELAAVMALMHAARSIAGPILFLPSVAMLNSRPLLSFGVFSWVQALSGTIFSQADRLIVAAMLGPADLAYYGLCVQAAQPIHGLAASASNVLFPHLSARFEQDPEAALGARPWRAVWLNMIFVVVLSLPLLFLSKSILSRWMGADFAHHAAASLSLVALSFVFLALNVPGHYALLALGRVRFLAGLNIVGGAVSVIVAVALIPHFGILGAAMGRLTYGPITWLLYPKLKRLLSEHAVTVPIAA